MKKVLRQTKERDLAEKQNWQPIEKFGVIYADPERAFKTYSENGMDRSADSVRTTVKPGLDGFEGFQRVSQGRRSGPTISEALPGSGLCSRRTDSRCGVASRNRSIFNPPVFTIPSAGGLPPPTSAHLILSSLK